MSGDTGPTGAPPRAVIAVDGIDGSGKSVLAARLAAAAADRGLGAVVLSVDDFRRPVEWSSPDRSEAQVYYEDYYDLPLLDACLGAFTAGVASLEIPAFDAIAHRLNGSSTLGFEGATLAVVEGVFALRLAALSTAAAVIYLRTSFATARRRILSRDTARGRHPDDVNHRIDARYFPAQRRYLREVDPVSHADILVENEDLASPRVLRFDTRRAGGVLTELLSAVLRSGPAPSG